MWKENVSKSDFVCVLVPKDLVAFKYSGNRENKEMLEWWVPYKLKTQSGLHFFKVIPSVQGLYFYTDPDQYNLNVNFMSCICGREADTSRKENLEDKETSGKEIRGLVTPHKLFKYIFNKWHNL